MTMTRYDYNAYTMNIIDEPIDMPFLAGGYTQADWDILNGALVDWEYYYDYCDTPEARHSYIEWWTKPYWA